MWGVGFLRRLFFFSLHSVGLHARAAISQYACRGRGERAVTQMDDDSSVDYICTRVNTESTRTRTLLHNVCTSYTSLVWTDFISCAKPSCFILVSRSASSSFAPPPALLFSYFSLYIFLCFFNLGEEATSKRLATTRRACARPVL